MRLLNGSIILVMGIGTMLVLAPHTARSAAKDVNVVNQPTVDAQQQGPWEVQVNNATGDPVPVVDVGTDERRGFVRDAEDTFGLVSSPTAPSSHDLVSLTGPGVFLSAMVVKQGGASDITNVRLFLDGVQVIAGNPASLRNLGLTEINPTGIAVFSGGVLDTITIGFPTPLVFEDSLLLRADILASDTGIVQLTGTVVHGQ